MAIRIALLTLPRFQFFEPFRYLLKLFKRIAEALCSPDLGGMRGNVSHSLLYFKHGSGVWTYNCCDDQTIIKFPSISPQRIHPTAAPSNGRLEKITSA